MHENLHDFEFRPDWTTDSVVSYIWKNPHRLIMVKHCLHFFSTVLDRILFLLAGNGKIHDSLDEFEIRLDPTTDFHGNK